MKRILSMAIASLVFISTVLPTNVFASETSDIYPAVPLVAPHESQNEGNISTTIQNENARYGERVYATVIATETHTFKVKPTGQPSGGYCFPGGGSVNVIKNTGTPVTVSVGLAWDWFSFSITPGTMSNGSSVGGVSVNIPANNNYYQVYGEFVYKFNRVRIDEYQYSELINTYYKTTSELISERWYPERVS